MVSGDNNIVIEENGEIKTVLVRSLYCKLNGRVRAFKKTVDRVSQISQVNSKIKVQSLKDGKIVFSFIKTALCGFDEIFKLRGDRIALTATCETDIFHQNRGFVRLEQVYNKDMIQYINQNGILVFDWVVDVDLKGKDFVYDFITEVGNFVCNRVVIGNAE
jgi:hypothetical protein